MYLHSGTRREYPSVHPRISYLFSISKAFTIFPFFLSLTHTFIFSWHPPPLFLLPVHLVLHFASYYKPLLSLFFSVPLNPYTPHSSFLFPFFLPFLSKNYPSSPCILFFSSYKPLPSPELHSHHLSLTTLKPSHPSSSPLPSAS